MKTPKPGSQAGPQSSRHRRAGHRHGRCHRGSAPCRGRHRRLHRRRAAALWRGLVPLVRAAHGARHGAPDAGLLARRGRGPARALGRRGQCAGGRPATQRQGADAAGNPAADSGRPGAKHRDSARRADRRRRIRPGGAVECDPYAVHGPGRGIHGIRIRPAAPPHAERFHGMDRTRPRHRLRRGRIHLQPAARAAGHARSHRRAG